MKSLLLKSVMKRLASRVNVDVYQRLMAYAIVRSAFKELAPVRQFPTREQLWINCIEDVVGSQTAITYVEFGVYGGRSAALPPSAKTLIPFLLG